MKAIHNTALSSGFCGVTVFNTTNIQNESNSQRGMNSLLKTLNCIQYYKYTK